MSEETKFLVFNKEGHMEQALGEDELQERLAQKTEALLRREIANSARSVDSRVHMAAANSQMELDRRAGEEMRILTRKTTWISAVVGVVGTIIGVLLGAWLNN